MWHLIETTCFMARVPWISILLTYIIGKKYEPKEYVPPPATPVPVPPPSPSKSKKGDKKGSTPEPPPQVPVSIRLT